MFVPNKAPVTRLDYCQYLLSSQINYTLTNFADHSQQFSHDQLNRFLRDDKPETAPDLGASQRFACHLAHRLSAL
jgi:hypothetical protein